MAVPFPLLLLAWSRDARAVGPERPLLPAYGIAGDDGAASLWRNPANLAFDPDPGYALIYRQELVGSGAPAFSASGNTGPLGMGVQYSVGADGTPWWTLASGFGLKLDRDLSLGVNVGWQLPSGEDNNLTTWDVGVGYRPLPWLGVAGIMQNIGSPAPERGVAQHYGVGVAIRPLGERAIGFEMWNQYRPVIKDGCVGCGLCVEVCPEPSLPIWIVDRSQGTVVKHKV